MAIHNRGIQSLNHPRVSCKDESAVWVCKEAKVLFQVRFLLNNRGSIVVLFV